MIHTMDAMVLVCMLLIEQQETWCDGDRWWELILLLYGRVAAAVVPVLFTVRQRCHFLSFVVTQLTTSCCLGRGESWSGSGKLAKDLQVTLEVDIDI